MKKSRYTEEQIIGILKQREAGVKTSDLCHEHEIGAATFYGWQSKYGGMEVSDSRSKRTCQAAEVPDQNCPFSKSSMNTAGH